MTELLRMGGASTGQQFVLSILMTLGVFALLSIYALGLVESTAFVESISLLVVREWIATLAFWYQSSAGSKAKDARPPEHKELSVVQPSGLSQRTADELQQAKYAMERMQKALDEQQAVMERNFLNRVNEPKEGK